MGIFDPFALRKSAVAVTPTWRFGQKIRAFVSESQLLG
ncbi:hypothetical protein C4K18_0631 [Pseudomonas chlororaphis subsp. aurantiaca]|nr:hypothetical protein C4K18_0631 [Pseudomonas chlororaphis subsp. aurantiaca]